MKRIQTLGVAVVAMAMLAPVLLAASAAEPKPKPEVTLKAGDPAPPLLIEKWVKGEPVKKLEKGKVYVMEFWATWCGPCIAAFPHVTELQKKFADKGVTVIGVNVWERDRPGVEPFVKKQGERMGYTVAMEQPDDGKPNEGKMAQTWMKAAGRNGIPCSFIIDREGKIAWIGHPMQMDRPLEQVVAGTFDAQAEAAVEAKRTAQQQELSTAMRAKDWDKALALIDEMIAADAGSAKMYRFAKLQMLYQKGDAAAANAMAKDLSQQAGDKADRDILLPIVQIMVSANAKDLDKDLMLSLAKRVAEKAAADDWQSPMLLARVHAAREDYEKAAEAQRAAVEKSDGPRKAVMERTLKEYEQKGAEKKPPA
jgi:thiol-disulfide isomerase/thioredoxin